MSLASRLDKIQAELRTRSLVDEPWLFYALHEWAEGCPIAFEEWEKDSIPGFEATALDRLVAAGKIREQDRERVTFIIRTIVHPPKYPDDPRELVQRGSGFAP